MYDTQNKSTSNGYNHLLQAKNTDKVINTLRQIFTKKKIRRKYEHIHQTIAIWKLYKIQNIQRLIILSKNREKACFDLTKQKLKITHL